MHPFTLEQMGNQHGRDLRARGAQKALVASYESARGGNSHLLSRLGARLRSRDARREPAPVLLLVPRPSVWSVHSLGSNEATGREGNAC